jgi:phytoene dehydrogenase-like protein
MARTSPPGRRGSPLARRRFLAAAACCAAFPPSAEAPRRDVFAEIPGEILGASYKLGHRLRQGGFSTPSTTVETGVVIVGGGIAGLSAAWKLQKSGFDDFLLLELEREVGGNAQSGENALSPYPWGAHYVPLLTDEARVAQELFADLGIIRGRENGLPVYDDYCLCSDPHERLHMYGRWQEGMVPQLGIAARDREQYRAFFAAMEEFKARRGKDGRKAFAIPLELSSRDPELLQLDRISMAEYLRQQGWDSPYLAWYVDYCCRDDYGARPDAVSAWAGIHYFAARTGQAANADPQTVVTWPEGNGWIVKRLQARLGDHIRTNALAFSVAEESDHVAIAYLDVTRNETILVKAKSAVLAVPRFIARRLTGARVDREAFQYSPWMVANLALDALPGGEGAPLSWDNMIYGSPLLGYVDATHQDLRHQRRGTTLTYYWPLSDLPPDQARAEALSRPYAEWRDRILTELLTIHPELDGHVRRLDVWLWGHGMIRPVPGFIWGPERRDALVARAPLFHAHSDMSGISIFEEANYHGVKGAEQVLAYLGHRAPSSL